MDYREDLVKILKLDHLNLPKIPPNNDPYFNFSPRTSLVDLLDPNKNYQPIPSSLKSHHIRTLESIKPGPIPGFNSGKLDMMSFILTFNSNSTFISNNLNISKREGDSFSYPSNTIEDESTVYSSKRKNSNINSNTNTLANNAIPPKKSKTTTIIRTTKL